MGWILVGIQILTCGGILATLYVAWVGLRLRVAPDVIVHAEPDSHEGWHVTIVVENIGRSHAFNVRHKLFTSGGEQLSAVPHGTSGPVVLHDVPVLAPGSRREYSWGTLAGIENGLQGGHVRVSTTYEGRNMPRLLQDTLSREAISVLEVSSLNGTIERRDRLQTLELQKVRALDRIAQKITPQA